MKEILQDYSLSELQILMEEWGERKFRAAQIFRGLMQGKRVSDLSELSKTLRAFHPTARKSIFSNLRTGTSSKAC